MPTVNRQRLGEITQRIADNCTASLKLETGDVRGSIQDQITNDLKELVKLVGIDNLKALAEEG